MRTPDEGRIPRDHLAIASRSRLLGTEGERMSRWGVGEVGEGIERVDMVLWVVGVAWRWKGMVKLRCWMYESSVDAWKILSVLSKLFVVES